MAAIQEHDRLAFGTGRLYFTPFAATQRRILGALNDVEVDFAIEQKEIYGEGSWALSVADGHRTAKITARHYQLNLDSLANDFNSSVTASVNAAAVDEAGIVDASAHTVVLAHTPVAGTLDLVVFIAGAGGLFYPVHYTVLASGSAVAGVSAVISGATLMFAAGDASLVTQSTYMYANTDGSSVLISQTYQNSSPFYSMSLIKRDRSPIDNATGFSISDFFAVRPGGSKMPYKENEYSNYEKTWSAFADPTGKVARVTFVNE